MAMENDGTELVGGDLSVAEVEGDEVGAGW